MRRRWEREEAQAQGGRGPLAGQLPAPPPGVLAGEPGPVVADPVALDGLAGELAELRTVLEPYVVGQRQVSADDVAVLERVDALRQGLEAVHGRRLLLVGEQREPRGSRVEVVAEARTVRGVVVGASVEDVWNVDEVTGTARVGDVEEPGRVFGA